jgi:hypothetical protein
MQEKKVEEAARDIWIRPDIIEVNKKGYKTEIVVKC